jgi:hypothetical protein
MPAQLAFPIACKPQIDPNRNEGTMFLPAGARTGNRCRTVLPLSAVEANTSLGTCGILTYRRCRESQNSTHGGHTRSNISSQISKRSRKRRRGQGRQRRRGAARSPPRSRQGGRSAPLGLWLWQSMPSHGRTAALQAGTTETAIWDFGGSGGMGLAEIRCLRDPRRRRALVAAGGANERAAPRRDARTAAWAGGAGIDAWARPSRVRVARGRPREHLRRCGAMRQQPRKRPGAKGCKRPGAKGLLRSDERATTTFC